MSLILFPTWIVVNDVNFGFDKVIQWVLRRHKVFTHEEERLFVRSLLCPFILLLNGWTCSPTYCNPQTWQSRRLSTLGVLQLTGKEYKIFCNVNCKTTIVVYRLDYDLRHDNWWSRDYLSNQITETDEDCRSSEISVSLFIITVFL